MCSLHVYHIPREDTSLQNYRAQQCGIVCEPELLYIYANAAVLLHFLLMMRTLPFSLQVKLTIFMELSVIQHHLLFSFSSVTISGVCYLI